MCQKEKPNRHKLVALPTEDTDAYSVRCGNEEKLIKDKKEGKLKSCPFLIDSFMCNFIGKTAERNYNVLFNRSRNEWDGLKYGDVTTKYRESPMHCLLPCNLSQYSNFPMTECLVGEPCIKPSWEVAGDQYWLVAVSSEGWTGGNGGECAHSRRAHLSPSVLLLCTALTASPLTTPRVSSS